MIKFSLEKENSNVKQKENKLLKKLSKENPDDPT